MTTIVTFGFTKESVRDKTHHALSQKDFDTLRSTWPGQIFEHAISIEGRSDSDEVHDALEILSQIGRYPKVFAFPGIGKICNSPLFYLTAKRVYSRVDANVFEYFRFFPTDKLAEEDIYRLPDGTREKYLDGKKISKRHGFGFAGPFNWACKAFVRAELEAQGFVGLAFEEMPQKPLSKPYEPIFRLVSTLTLPSVLNPLYNEDGELCRGDFSRGCVPDNSIISGLPLYYDEAAVRVLEPFDCAWTAEAFGGIHWRNRSFIVSKRFLEYCWGRGWNCDFVPVILRADGVAPPLEPLFPWLGVDAT